MTKVVINNQHGGFNLSEKALDKLVEEHGFTVTGTDDDGGYKNPDADIHDFTREYDFTGEDGKPYTKRYYGLDDSYDEEIRCHPAVIEVVEELGSEEASGQHSTLKVVEVLDDVEFEIKEYDGNEWVAEKHRTWS